MSGSKRDRRAKRRLLFKRQKGLCHWCQQPMLLLETTGKTKEYPANMATFEHLDDKFSEQRGEMGGWRIRLACRTCNENRGRERQMSLSRDDIRQFMERKKEAKRQRRIQQRIDDFYREHHHKVNMRNLDE